MLSKRLSKPILISVLILITVFTRFTKLNWGDSYFFHPDENNMATSVSQISFSNFNPHFFAYGQFPLYLSFFSIQLAHFVTHFSFLPKVSFAQAIIMLRIWSALFSLIAVLFFYLIGQNIFKKRYHSYIFTLLIIFNPGLIELAHFGTTESILVAAFAINIFLALKIFEKYQFKFLFFSALVTGIALASKITAIFFILPILISLLFIFLKSNKKVFLFLSTFNFLLLTIMFFLIFSPYNLISHQDFISAIIYETSVASGNLKVFYTNQFLNTTPYIFQLTHIFPYVSGLPVFIFGITGLIFILKSYFLNHKLSKESIIIFIPVLIYFVYNGQLYTKWTRFMSPIFFIFPLLSVYLLRYINNKKIIFIITLLAVLPGLLFLKNYLMPDIRVQASNWIKTNIPADSSAFSEAGNVVNLPLNNSINVFNFDFYNLDNNPNLISSLPVELEKNDYIIIPSRRIFKNQSNSLFPISQLYYQNLFSENLGFVEVKQFKPPADFILNSENAEETWTVFDRPTIRIFKKVKNLSVDDYHKLLIKNESY